MFTAQYRVQRLLLSLGLLALVSLGAPNVLLGGRGNAALAQSAQTSNYKNLNLNFEVKSSQSDLPQGWIIVPSGQTPPAYVGGKSEIGLDANNVYSGSYSLRIHRETTLPQEFNFGGVTRAFPVDNAKGKVIRLSGYIKTQDVQGGQDVRGGFAGLWMRVDGSGEQKVLAFNNMHDQKVHGTTGWTHYQIELPVYDNAKDIYFGVLMNGTGTAWFDDLSIQVLNEPAARTPPWGQVNASTPSHFWTDFAQSMSSTANISQQALQQQMDLLSSGVHANWQALQQQMDTLKGQLTNLKQQESQHPTSDLEKQIAGLKRELANLNVNLQQQRAELERQLAELEQQMADLKKQEAQQANQVLEQSITVYQAVIDAVEKLLARAGGMQ
jgi:hypothetical protein